MSWNRRKGCKGCKAPLTGWKQTVTGYCPNCAEEARAGFKKMGTGKIQEGLMEVLSVKGNCAEEEADTINKTIKATIKKQRKKIEKKLRKKGLTEEEIREGLKKFNPSKDQE